MVSQSTPVSPSTPHRPPSRSRTIRAIAVASCSIVLGLASWLAGDPLLAQPTETFTDAQRVTATDVLVRFERGAMSEWATGGEAPRRLGPEDFALLVGETSLPVVAAVDGLDDEPWRLVVWVDAELANPALVRWAMSLLGDRVEALAALGTVEIIVADPLPHQRLAPTGDPGEIARVLAEIALEPPGADGLLELRDELMAELGMRGASEPPPAEPASDEPFELRLEDPEASPEPEAPPALDGELLAALVAEEASLVSARHDLLLDHATAGGTPGGRRALLLVSGSFDLDPTAYYREFAEPESPLPRRALDTASELARIHHATGRALAAYGWTPLVLLPPEPELLVRGWRVGKLLIRPVGPYLEIPDPIDVSTTESAGMRGLLQRFGRIFFFGVHAKVEGRRDPERADAYLELADALRAQGKLGDAADSYSKALYHFASDPRTADEQARAYAGLGEVLAQQGEATQAHQAYRAALTLEPSLAEDLGATVAFDDPVGIWSPWAEAGDGVLVGDHATLDQTLGDLAGRWRLTYQLEGVSPGQLLPIAVSLPDREIAVHHTAWARAGTPEVVVEARLRGLLEGLVADPGIDAGLGVELGYEGGEAILLHASPSGAEAETRPVEGPRFVRVSIAADRGDGLPAIEHQTLSTAVLAAKDGARLSSPLVGESDPRRVAVVVEDLLRGSWGAAAVDLR